MQAALIAFHGADLAGKDGPLAKIGFDLDLLYQEKVLFDAAADGTTFEASNPAIQVRGDRVAIDVVTVEAASRLQGALAALGMTNYAAAASIASGYFPIDQLANLAGLIGVKFARPTYKAITNAGSVSGQGDAAMHSDDARTMLNVDGTGIRIGVISDSYNTSGIGSAAADVASGDLPATGVTVIQDSPGGTDEGRAMLQIVHDVAPGASLAFATADGGEAGFANNIRALANNGASVIVDDVFYPTEPFFQDGLVAQAVDSVRNRGVAYFSSAGNQGTNAYQSAFADSGVAGPGGGTLHDFDPGPGVDTQMQITVGAFQAAVFVLQWDQPFASLGSAGSTNDLDIFVYDSAGTNMLSFSAFGNVGGDPFEYLYFPNFSTNTTFTLKIERYSGQAAGLMRVLSLGSGSFDEFNPNGGPALFGHNNADGAVGVAAAAYFMTPEFNVTPPQLNNFSSLGGTPILFDTAGNRLATQIDRNHPQVAGPDGVNTTFFGDDIPEDTDTLPNFFGTSAAAPHVAAVAALIQQAAGGSTNITPSRILQLLQNTAVDITSIGDPFNFPSAPVSIPGGGVGFDLFSGSGFVNAFEAVDAAKVPLVSINDVTQFEGDSGANNFVFTVSLSEVGRRTVMINYSTANGTATAPGDYSSQSGVLTFAPGETLRQITVVINGEETVEANETFFVNLAGATNAALIDDQGKGTILNDDVPPPSIYVGDITITQTTGGPAIANFTVALSTAISKTVTVNYATVDGTALAGSDYTAVNGLLTIPAGTLNRTISVPIAANTAGENNEFFKLLLSNPARAIIADPLGIATIVNSIPDPTEVIIDNGDAGFTQSGSWSLGTNLTGYGLDYMYSAAGKGQDRVSWTIDNLPSDVYHVYTRWVPFANRATNALFTVFDDNQEMGTTLVDQTKIPADSVANAVNWKSLGTYNITSGTLAVVLSDAANGFVTADAVRIVRGDGTPPAAEIDVVGNSLSILDGDVTPTNSDSTDFGTTSSVTGAVTRTFTIRNQGAVALHLSGSPKVQISGANAGDFTVTAQPADTLAPISGTTNFSIVFAPTAQGLRTATVTISSDDADEALYDFSIQGIGGVAGPTEKIIDDGGSGFTQSGSWQTTQNTIANQGDLRTSAAGSGGDTTGWTFNNLSPGVYQVYATWVGFSNRATNAPYTIVDGTQQEAVVRINQQLFPNDVAAGGINWESLGMYTITSGSLKVGLSDAANGVVVADAIRIVRTGDVPAALASAASAGSSSLAQASAAPSAPAAMKAAEATTVAAVRTAAAASAPLASNSLTNISTGINSRRRAVDQAITSFSLSEILRAARLR